MKKAPATPKVKLGPGEYRPDIAFTQLEDLPKAKVIKHSVTFTCFFRFLVGLNRVGGAHNL